MFSIAKRTEFLVRADRLRFYGDSDGGKRAATNYRNHFAYISTPYIVNA